MRREDDVLEMLNVLKDVPPPDPEKWDADRRTFLTATQNLIKGPVTSDDDVRRKGWNNWIERVRSFRLREVSMLTAMKVALVLALIFGGSAGTVQAARQSLPGTPLYPLKTQIEDWQLVGMVSPEARVEMALTFADTRVDEARRLGAAGQEIPLEVAARYEQHLGVALQASAGISEPLRLRVREQISETLGAQLRIMNQVMQQYKAGGHEDAQGPVQTMIQTMERAQAQFVGENGQGPGSETGFGENHSYGPSEGHVDDEETGGPGPGEAQGPGSEEGGPGPGEAPEGEGGYGPGAGPDDGGYGPGEPNEEAGPPEETGDDGSQNGVDRHDGPGGEQDHANDNNDGGGSEVGGQGGGGDHENGDEGSGQGGGGDHHNDHGSSGGGGKP